MNIQADGEEFKRLYGTRTDRQLARIFTTSISQVRRLGTQLALRKDKKRFPGTTRMPRWTGSDVAQLRRMYSDYSNLEIAKELDRSVASIVAKAHSLDLHKPKAYLEEMGRENVSKRYV